MLMYRVRWKEIEAREVLRTTEKQVVLANKHRKGGEERENKETEWHSWHETWETAHAHMIAKAQAEVDRLRQQLQRANGDLGRIKGMKAPANAALRRAATEQQNRDAG